MSAAHKLLPFRAKAEERAAAKGSTGDDSGASSALPAPPVKKACTAYEKQLQKMEGDVSFIKDFMLLKLAFNLVSCVQDFLAYEQYNVYICVTKV